MQVKFIGIVKEIKDWNTDKEGHPLPADKVTSQITFFDRKTGGDVTITFPAGHGLTVGEDVEMEAEVKPQIRNYKLSLYAQPVQHQAEKAPAPTQPKK